MVRLYVIECGVGCKKIPVILIYAIIYAWVLLGSFNNIGISGCLIQLGMPASTGNCSRNNQSVCSTPTKWRVCERKQGDAPSNSFTSISSDAQKEQKDKTYGMVYHDSKFTHWLDEPPEWQVYLLDQLFCSAHRTQEVWIWTAKSKRH